MARSERLEGSEVAKWERQIVRWQGGKGRRVVKWQGRRLLVVFKGGGCRVTPRFHLLVSDVDQRNDGAGWVQDDLA